MSDREAFEAWCIKSGINPGNLAAWHGYQAGRVSALEEAAQVCDSQSYPGKAPDDYGQGWNDVAISCAAAIRAMAEGKE